MRWSGTRRMLLWVVVLCVAIGAVACKRNESGQLPAASGEAIKADKQAITGFVLARAYPDQTSDGLSLALEFSRPLVGTQDFDALVRFEEKVGTGDSSWTLSDDGKTLRYPYVEAAKDYTVLVDANLLAADGSRLGKPLKQKVYTGALKPVAGFASQGSVLPARESRGLPVVSVNVPEVDVEFLRVREKSLPAFFQQFQRGGRRGSWELESEYNDKQPLSRLAEPVYVNRFILGGKQNERVLTYLPTQDIKELQEPGLYFAVMKRAGSFENEQETAFFTVSDIGLHTRAYKDKLFVHTASLQSGEPIKNVEVRILDAKGELFLKGATDGNGNALLNYTLDAGHVLVARSKTDISVLPFNQPALDLSEFAVAGRESAWFDVFAWAGRDLYRPGETMRVSAILRDNDGKPTKPQPVFLRLKQPDGKTFRETRLQPGEQGYFEFSQQIPADAPTGRWQVEFRTDPTSKDAVQGMSVRVEEFLPERMKLDLDSTQKTLSAGQPFTLLANAAYLYGAPADGNRFTAKLAVSVEQHPLDSLPGWFFGDPTLELPREAKDVIDTTFGSDGVLREDIALPAEARPVSTIAAVVSGSVYETGGRTVTRTVKRVLWPAKALVGVRPLFDDKDGTDANGTARFELTRVDADGKPQPAKGLKATLVRELRDYHWNYTDDHWDYDFTRRFENKDTRTLDIAGGNAKLEFPVEWGEYRLDVFDPATGLTTRYPFRAGWSWNDENRGLDARPDKVKLALDKTGYRAGDTLTVTLTPPHAGKGVLLVESDKLLYVQDIDVKPGSTFDIPVTEAWERHDVYVTALVFRGGSAPSKITPARAVGVAYVPMDRKARRVAVGLAAPKQMRPEQALPVTVSVPELAGKAAHVTISAVDVGILNITRFPVPDANAQFFAQRRLGTDAYDIYGRVIESFEGASGKLKFGGDMALEALPQAKRPTARVQTVDLFSGSVKLDARGNARVQLPVPDFNGTLRVSALVYSETRFGNQSMETVVRAPILAEASMPRVMAPGDRSTVTLDVQNFTGKPGEFNVRVDGIGPLAIAEAARSVKLGADAKQTLSFPLSATEGYSVAKVRVRVDGNGFKADRSYDLPVRAGWPQVLRAQTRVLDPLSPVSLDSGFADGLMAGSVTARMVVSPLPPIPFASALQGALDYPYGCAEQTTSKGYAALLLDDATARALGTKGLEAAKRRERMEGAFGRLASMQIASGHFSMWGDDGYVNPGLTPYIAEFLLDAKDAGFAVPDNVLQKALNRLSEDLLSGGNEFYGQDRRDSLKFANQAWSGYVLARVNRAPLGTLRALYDNQRDKALTGLSLVHLGAALSLQGDTKRGQAAIKAGFAKDSSERPSYFADYGSAIRDDALMMALLHERGLSRPEYDTRAVALGRALDARRATGWLWLSTQEQVALARLGKALMVGQGKQVSGTLSVGGETQQIAPARLFGRSFDSAALARGVQFAPQGEAPMYASLEVAGIPRSAPEPDTRTLSVERSWYTTDGKPWTPRALKEGEALIVRVAITANSDMPDALLTDLLPAGLEIENFNLGDAKQWADVVVDGIGISERSSAADVKHEEFRDDRYVAALALSSGSKAQLYYLVRAVTPGTYTVPPSLVEDMYRPELRGVGRSTPATMTVVQP
ncbi:alpha-2-macroglobulin family protein [Xanthomonas arboricola pv. juglandis]|uniref:alpha-2-macroglobulin family protein n=1 Tax=Xanthomonas TaxID=338 RepID=UPI000E861B98|nr:MULTISPECIES: alpha-2-macroglobulin [Xanthomonas]CAG2086230.1 alpha-2-macroglobulin family protein [Xanthomonas euroxanthea]SYZ54648.1 alpha-2-macroglobulin family protein [Xanthomonas arboricola pv. juglandis]